MALSPAAAGPRRVPFARGAAWGPPLALALLLLLNAFFTPGFLSVRTLDVLLTQIAPIGIVATGMTLVIATGGIDLSVGSLMAIAGATAPLIVLSHWGQSSPPALVGAVAVGAALGAAGLLGLFNGTLVTLFRVQPIIATLVLYIAGRGVAQVLTGGRLQTFHGAGFQFLGLGRVGGVPFQFLLMGLVVGGAAWAVGATAWGRYLLAAGGNEAAARLSGVPTDRVKRTAYALSGLLAGLAGLISVSIVSASDAGQVGQLMELDAIVAVAVGGTPLSGGRASVGGTLIGAAIVLLIRFALLARNVPPSVALIINGAIIVLAVALQRTRRA